MLKQPVPASVASSEGYEDKRLPVLLIQKLLSKAIQPSPIRAVFSKREMESAALDVSQYLSSAAAAKRINLEGNVGRPPTATKVTRYICFEDSRVMGN